MRAELFSPAALVFHCDFSMSASGCLEKHGCTCSERPLSADSVEKRPFASAEYWGS